MRLLYPIFSLIYFFSTVLCIKYCPTYRRCRHNKTAPCTADILLYLQGFQGKKSFRFSREIFEKWKPLHVLNNSPREPQSKPGDGRRQGRSRGRRCPPRYARSSGTPRPFLIEFHNRLHAILFFQYKNQNIKRTIEKSCSCSCFSASHTALSIIFF